MSRVTGVSPEISLLGFNNDINTLERAVKERVFFVKRDGQFAEPPTPDPGHFAATMHPVRTLLSKYLPRTTPLSLPSVVETFRGRKKQIYQQALESLMRRSVSQKDAEVKVFVKYEKTDFTSKKDPVPRVISPRDPRYNLELAAFLRKVEEPIFESLSHLFEGFRTVFKGINAAESGKCMFDLWSQFKRPVAVGLDASRFDQHVSRQALEWEHSLYPLCFPKAYHKRLGRLLSWQVKNTCRGYTNDGKLKYTKEGGRMSGDMNTSLGNCILMCSMIKQYADTRGVRVLLANNGDDCVVFMEQEDLARFSAGLDQWFTAMGFTMTVEEPVYNFEEIEFCQTHPVYTGPGFGDYIMMRHPRRAISKDSVSLHRFQSDRQYRGWLDAVGTGGLSMTGGLPVFQEFYRCYQRYGAPHRQPVQAQSWGVRSLQKGMVRSYGPVSPASRYSFWLAFGITPDEQLLLEDYYRKFSLDSAPRDGLVFRPRELM